MAVVGGGVFSDDELETEGVPFGGDAPAAADASVGRQTAEAQNHRARGTVDHERRRVGSADARSEKAKKQHLRAVQLRQHASAPFDGGTGKRQAGYAAGPPADSRSPPQPLRPHASAPFDVGTGKRQAGYAAGPPADPRSPPQRYPRRPAAAGLTAYGRRPGGCLPWGWGGGGRVGVRVRSRMGPAAR
ncbi:hypothetical protein BAE44_0002875 [Dichanthelium oligosanthes]|uniref:Uncharacterized protein n=1 Tax=Dichanthelium oligosanthes TaxID=888268 RepID=A0A1E5WFJ0_9POAL|nr:hypothetical protein BAE44_0002875 [Dichanthelium oligosanthes]